jgi:hypothetical protein
MGNLLRLPCFHSTFSNQACLQRRPVRRSLGEDGSFSEGGSLGVDGSLGEGGDCLAGPLACTIGGAWALGALSAAKTRSFLAGIALTKSLPKS